MKEAESDVRKLRKKLGLNQAEFAVKLGVAEFTVRRWESGGTKPSPMAQRLIKELFGIEIKSGENRRQKTI